MSRAARTHDASGGVGAQSSGYDVEAVRRDFPGLHQEVHGRPLAYLDNAATAQKPQQVIDAELGYYREDCANIHRGVHLLSQRATEKYEEARGRLQRFLGAGESREIVLLRSATEAVNLVAQSWGRPRLGAGDEILITHLEHHSNIVPWQLLCEQTGACLRVAPIDDSGAVVMDEFERLLGPRTRLVAVAHVSNALGTHNPVERMIALAHDAGALALLDGAQATPHVPVDVHALDCDFYAVSAHKMYGPTGVGALFARAALLEEMPPWQGGGDMIRSVSFEETLYNDIPFKFEAGTPNIAGGIGFGAAAQYLEALGFERIHAHEQSLLAAATEALGSIPGVRLIGTAPGKSAVLSFVIEGVHPHDAGTVLDREGIAVRTGHHCAQPVMEHYGIPATVRASFGVYNTLEEVERLAEGVRVTQQVLGR